MITTRLAARLGITLVAAATALAIAPGASALPVPPPVGPAPPPVLDVTAHPSITWSVPDRYDGSWAAYRPASATYDPDFVNPAAWSVNLNGCLSTSRYRIVRYAFTVAQVGTTWRSTTSSTACAIRLHTLPAQGSYTVTLTLATSIGISLPQKQAITIRDHLIVSMGDSLASGEGNPDVNGVYDVRYVFGVEWSVSTEQAAVWRDARCHRSARSAPALAAEAFERADPHTSVTFISFACSGAVLNNLLPREYGGVIQTGQANARQIDSVAASVARYRGRPARRIDTLLISAGINDLGFSGIIHICASNRGNDLGCVTDSGIADKLNTLPLKYANLAVAIRDRLPNTGEVYLNDYPGHVFDGGAYGDGLGLTELGFYIGITAAEGAEMARWGDALNAKITNATRTFRHDPYRWNLIGSLNSAFRSHAYSDTPSWFTTYDSSWERQGDEDGTAHPNRAGTLAYASLIKRAVVVNQ